MSRRDRNAGWSRKRGAEEEMVKSEVEGELTVVAGVVEDEVDMAWVKIAANLKQLEKPSCQRLDKNVLPETYLHVHNLCIKSDVDQAYEMRFLQLFERHMTSFLGNKRAELASHNRQHPERACERLMEVFEIFIRLVNYCRKALRYLERFCPPVKQCGGLENYSKNLFKRIVLQSKGVMIPMLHALHDMICAGRSGDVVDVEHVKEVLTILAEFFDKSIEPYAKSLEQAAEEDLDHLGELLEGLLEECNRSEEYEKGGSCSTSMGEEWNSSPSAMSPGSFLNAVIQQGGDAMLLGEPSSPHISHAAGYDIMDLDS